MLKNSTLTREQDNATENNPDLITSDQFGEKPPKFLQKVEAYIYILYVNSLDQEFKE